jgi:hypothetical protein
VGCSAVRINLLLMVVGLSGAAGMVGGLSAADVTFTRTAWKVLNSTSCKWRLNNCP